MLWSPSKCNWVRRSSILTLTSWHYSTASAEELRSGSLWLFLQLTAGGISIRRPSLFCVFICKCINRVRQSISLGQVDCPLVSVIEIRIWSSVKFVSQILINKIHNLYHSSVCSQTKTVEALKRATASTCPSTCSFHYFISYFSLQLSDIPLCSFCLQSIHSVTCVVHSSLSSGGKTL